MIHADDLRNMKCSRIQDILDRIERGLITVRRLDISHSEYNVRNLLPGDITVILKELRDSGYECDYDETTMKLAISW